MLPSTAGAAALGEAFAYQVRWEGTRALVGFEGRQVFCRGTTGQDLLPWFPEVSQLYELLKPQWVLVDVEIICVHNGRPDRDALRRRTLSSPFPHHGAPPAELRCVVADVLRIGNSWLLDVAWEERQEILREIFTPRGIGVLSPVFPTAALAARQAERLALTDLLAKRRRGRYYPGEQSREWLCVKRERLTSGSERGRSRNGATKVLDPPKTEEL